MGDKPSPSVDAKVDTKDFTIVLLKCCLEVA